MLIHKVQKKDKFLDISDYGRPVANYLTKILIPTKISSVSITLFYTICGFTAAILYSSGKTLNFLVAAILLQVKNILDAVDGSLARSRNKPTKTGRYLDSICDFIVNFFVYWGIFFYVYKQPVLSLIPSLFCLLFAHLQCSYYNYAYLLYRDLTKGDTTSCINEEKFFCYDYENKKIVFVLQKLYLLIYGWQDKLMIWIDNFTINNKLKKLPLEKQTKILFKLNTNKNFLTLVSALALGTQLLIITFFSFLSFPHYALWFFASFANLFWILILIKKIVNLKYLGNHLS